MHQFSKIIFPFLDKQRWCSYLQHFDLTLTVNFSLSEFAVSKQYPELAKAIWFSDVEIERARFAAAAFLQPIRDHFGPVLITSGKRTLALNEAVGGTRNSSHLFSRDRGAVDFTVQGVRCDEIFDWMRLNTPNFRKIIKYSSSPASAGFIHLSFPDSSGIYGQAYEYKDGIYVKV